MWSCDYRVCGPTGKPPSPNEKTRLKAYTLRRVQLSYPRYHSNCGESSAAHGPHQVRCPYAAGSGRLYSRFRFLPSGSGATANRFFPRLAPPAASLLPKPAALSFKAVTGSLRSFTSLVNAKLSQSVHFEPKGFKGAIGKPPCTFFVKNEKISFLIE